MQPHKIVSHDEWLAARKAHLADEKAFTCARDALSRKRRELPWEKVEKSYVFDGPNGKETLAELFGGKSQLIVYHFMLGPGLGGRLPELFAARRSFRRRGRSTSRNATSPSSSCRARRLPQIEKFKRRMGWNFKWVSSFGNDFNFDYHVSATPEEKANGGVTLQLRQ